MVTGGHEPLAQTRGVLPLVAGCVEDGPSVAAAGGRRGEGATMDRAPRHAVSKPMVTAQITDSPAWKRGEARRRASLGVPEHTTQSWPVGGGAN